MSETEFQMNRKDYFYCLGKAKGTTEGKCPLNGVSQHGGGSEEFCSYGLKRRM